MTLVIRPAEVSFVHLLRRAQSDGAPRPPPDEAASTTTTAADDPQPASRAPSRTVSIIKTDDDDGGAAAYEKLAEDPRLLTWDGVPARTFHAIARGAPLRTMAMAALKRLGALDGLGAAARRGLAGLFDAIAQGYRANTYHNLEHATDVVQATASMLASLDAHLGAAPCAGAASRAGAAWWRRWRAGACGGGGAGGARPPPAPLARWELVAAVVAAAGHDLGHPGVSNAYLVAAGSPQVDAYGAKAPNEEMHAALTLSLIEATGALDAVLSADAAARAACLAREMILATDMARHAATMAALSAALEAEPDARLWGGAARGALLAAALHVADISNPARAWPEAFAWGERVVLEFVAQGDAEAARGAAVTPQCDRTRVCLPAAQLGFSSLFVAAALREIAPAVPGFAAAALPCLAATQVMWAAVKDAGVTLPRAAGEYPPLDAAAGARAEAARAAAAAEFAGDDDDDNDDDDGSAA